MKTFEFRTPCTGLTYCVLSLSVALVACQSSAPSTETLTLKSGTPVEIPLTATFEERTQYFEAMQALATQIPSEAEGEVPLSFQGFVKRAKKYCEETGFFTADIAEDETTNPNDTDAILAKHYRELC